MSTVMNKLIKRVVVFSVVIFLCVSSQAARVDTVHFESAIMHKQIKFVVVSPKGAADKKYPVVYLLHGYSGNFSNWLKDAPQLEAKADELGLILVTPDGGYGSWYFDSPIDSTLKYESYFTKELIPYINDHFPVINNKAARAITGLSMGGHGALYLAIRHNELFGAAGSICGGVDFRPFPNNWDIKLTLGKYEENKKNWDDNVVINLIDSLKNKTLGLIVDCGSDDFFLPVNRNLHNKLNDLKIEHDYTERPGAHNKAYWGNTIDFQLLYFKKYFNKQQAEGKI